MTMYVIFKKSTLFLDYGGAPLFYVHSTFCVDDAKWLHSVSYWIFLPQHNSENKILIQCLIVRVLVVIFFRRATREAI